jgi:acylphosphatase
MIRNILIYGKVQGVFYRASAQEEAQRLKLSGWVRNLPDGNVEAMAQGTEEQLHQFTEWCRKGPNGAEVTQVVVKEIQEGDGVVNPQIQPGIFDILR